MAGNMRSCSGDGMHTHLNYTVVTGSSTSDVQPVSAVPCMAINVSAQYNGGLLPDIILLTQCYFHRGTRLNVMKRFCICMAWSAGTRR